MRKFVFYVLLVGFWVLSNIATGFTNSLIYNNGMPDLVNAYLSDSASITNTHSGDNFILTSGANVITDIRWWGVYPSAQPPTQDNFTVRIYNFVAGSPNLSSFYENNVGNVNRTDTGNNILSHEMYEYAADVQPLALAPGDSYLLSIVNNTVPTTVWYWATSNGSSGTLYSHRVAIGEAWRIYSGELAFNLAGPESAVPEPSTMLLLASGLIGLVGYGRKKFLKK